MPTVPLACSHDVVIEFLVEVVQQGDRLHYHRVDFVRAELEFVPRKTEKQKEKLCQYLGEASS